MVLWERGLISFGVKNAIPQASKCFAKTDPRKNLSRRTGRQVPISLNDLMGAFFILGIGLGLSTLVFLIEKIICFRGQQKKEADEAGANGEPAILGKEEPSGPIENLEQSCTLAQD